MVTLYLVRHAESEANAQAAYAGHQAIPLTERGRQEAAFAAKEFCAHTAISKIYSSPLLRAQQTASFFADQCHAPIFTNVLLQEQDMGDFTGLKYAVAEKLPTFEIEVGKRWHWRPPNGETYEQVAQRTLEFLKQLEKERDGENILAVTHGVFLRLIRGTLENTLPIFYTGLSRNCEIWKVAFKGVNIAHQIESIYYGKPDTKAHRE